MRTEEKTATLTVCRRMKKRPLLNTEKERKGGEKKKEKSEHLCFFEFPTLGGPKLFIVLVL